MRVFNYSNIKNQKWDSEVLGLIAAIYKFAGKQELYLKQRPEELEKLVEIAKIQSTETSNAIEGIVTTNTRIRQLVEEKTAPKNRDEQEIAGYRDVLNIIHENFDAIPISRNYILQLHKILYSHMNNPLAGQTKTVQNYISATYPDGHSETLLRGIQPCHRQYGIRTANRCTDLNTRLSLYPSVQRRQRQNEQTADDVAALSKRLLCRQIHFARSQDRQE